MRSRVTAILTTLALAGVLLGACGDDKPTGKKSDPPSASATASPTEGPSPTVTPATGKLIETPSFDVHLPADPAWMLGGSEGIVQSADFFTDTSLATIQVISSPGGTSDFKLNETNAFEIEKGQFPSSERLEDRTINGITAYVWEAPKDGRYRYVVGGLHHSYGWSVVFDFPNEWTVGRQVIEEILASIEFKTPPPA